VKAADPVALRLYHGSPDAPGRPAFGRDGNQRPTIAPGRPFFVTEDFAYAQYFARGGVVSELSVRFSRLADLRDARELERLLQIYNADPAVRSPWDEDVDGDISESSYALLESPGVMASLVEQGFDGVVLHEDIERGVESYALLCLEGVTFCSAQDMSCEADISLELSPG
jgi:hypothetical protein